MSLDVARPAVKPPLGAGAWGDALVTAIRCVLVLLGIAVIIQIADRRRGAAAGSHHRRPWHGRHHPARHAAGFLEATRARPGRRWKPSISRCSAPSSASLLAVPLALLAAANVTPSRYAYYCARGIIGFTRAVPDLVWALFFVTAVGLGPFPGGLGARRPFGRYARPAVRRNHRAYGHGADRGPGADRRAAHPGFHPRHHPDHPAVAARHQPLSARREHPLVARARFRRRRRHRLPAAHGT